MEVKLPLRVVSKRDVKLLIHEIELLLEQHLQHDVAAKHSDQNRAVRKPSATLQALFAMNNQQISVTALQHMKPKLDRVASLSPSVRIIFPSSPPQEVSDKMVQWFRGNIADNILVQISVQPNIAGGFVLRTRRHRYDFSLRESILSKASTFKEVLARVE